MGSRWYASEAAARRGECLAEVVPAGRNVLLCLWRCAGRYGTVLVWRTDVTGRSAAHIDRLARDFLAHGVSPCRDGSRGYNYRWWLDDSRSAAAACDLHQRAEARARRVVRR